MSVDNLHPDYVGGSAKWRKCRDAAGGYDAVVGNFSLYFPPFVPEQPERYKRVRQLSRYYDATGQTVTTLTGAAFSIEPTVDLPPSVEYLKDDADGAGNDLEQVAKQVVSNTTTVGRHGLLVDYPATEGENLTIEQVRALNLRASIKQYPAESVINWGFENGRLSYVVFLESVEIDSNSMFEHDTENVYRVYWMQDGQCLTGVYEAGDEVSNGRPVTKASGEVFEFIPFTFVGAMDNTPKVDRPPIDGLADSNLAHFKTSCTHVENLALHSQTTVFIDPGNMDAVTFKEVNGTDQLAFGANTAYVLGSGGGASTVTAPESTSLTKDLAILEQNMQAQGAQLVDRSAGAMTARQAGIEAKQRVSQMQNVVLNTSDAIRWCCDVAEMFMAPNPVGGSVYEIDTTFNDVEFSFEVAQMLTQARDRGDISSAEFRAYLSRANGLDLDADGETDAQEGR